MSLMIWVSAAKNWSRGGNVVGVGGSGWLEAGDGCGNTAVLKAESLPCIFPLTRK